MSSISKTRILVVDDAVVVRRVVSYVLSSDPALEVAGTAMNGAIALAKIAQLKPDLVTLDLEMPELDGLETLRVLRQKHPRLPVVMLSRYTERSSAATSKALLSGANDFVALPDGPGSIIDAVQYLREQLIPKIKVLTRPADAGADSSAPQNESCLSPQAPSQRIEIVAIGVSTGGPNVLGTVLPALDADFPVPIVIVQHMPPDFTRRLAEQLESKSAIHVGEGADNNVVSAGHAWVAPGGRHMLVIRDKYGARLQMSQSPPENYCRPSVDVLFRSVAEAYGAASLAVVLTGLGRDGLRGCEKIRAAGGQVIVQDEATSVVWGMPGAVAKAGLADRIVPLKQLAAEITCRVKARRTAVPRASGVDDELQRERK